MGVIKEVRKVRNKLVFNNGNTQQTNPDEVLKVTSLIYFKDALIKEQYENCRELIQTAKKFGAQQSEIRQIINEYIRLVASGLQNEASNRSVRRRQL